MPADLICPNWGTPSRSPAVDGTGTWTTETSGGVDDTVIQLDWTPTDTARGGPCRGELYVELVDGQLQLFQWVGDEDQDADITVDFTKEG